MAIVEVGLLHHLVLPLGLPFCHPLYSSAFLSSWRVGLNFYYYMDPTLVTLPVEQERDAYDGAIHSLRSNSLFGSAIIKQLYSMQLTVLTKFHASSTLIMNV